MKVLRVIRAKPNPIGKDRSGGTTPKKQLAAEWIDIKNTGDEPFRVDSISLQHIAYQPYCRDGKWEGVSTFSGVLQPGKVMRIHSGEQIQTSEMYPEDAAGADYHIFTGRNYVWNNDCGDTAGLGDGKVWIDAASYDPYPMEGKILSRQGDKLI